MESTEVVDRKFLGDLNPIVDRHSDKMKVRVLARHKANLEKKHLKAYLQGKEYFHYGRDVLGEPMRYKVMQNIIRMPKGGFNYV